jgi:hypothetical protein
MQCKHTCYALGFKNQNPRHGKTSPLLGESTPPQGVNGLIILDPYCLTRGGGLWVLSMLAILISILYIRLSNRS